MMIIYFFSGLCFGGLGLAAYLQMRQGADIPLKKQLPWLAAFGFAAGATGWLDMFLSSGIDPEMVKSLAILRMFLHPLSGVLLLRFGYGVLKYLSPMPAWAVFIPGILIVPIGYLVTYAATTFITPSPIEIPIDIWSRYLLYFPGSVLAGIGFLRQWDVQRKKGFNDVSKLMLGAGLAFLFEAFVVGFIVPAAPYSPASYYNYDRVVHNAFLGTVQQSLGTFGLDYERVLEVTGFTIQFWRLLSAFAVTFFVARGLDVFDTIRKRQLKQLQEERDRAQQAVVESQISARHTAENWTDTLVSISRQIAQLENVDDILLFIVSETQKLFQADFVGVGLVGEDENQLMLKCHTYGDKAEISRSSFNIDNPPILKSLRLNRAYRFPEDKGESIDKFIFPNSEKPTKTAVITPLVMDDQSVGVLWTVRCREESELFSQTDLIWLECIADQIVISIQHGLMTSQMQSLSIIEERGRIAREMHDGLAQVLGYLNLQVQTLEALLIQGKSENLHKEMSNMRKAIKTAHADVRENILSLRTTLANEKGLLSSIDEYLEEFSIQNAIDATLCNELSVELHLKSIAGVQLVCILQEALANVRKHARADKVKVTLSRDIHQGEVFLCMNVIDDGIGFTEKQSNRSFGIRTMQERATSVKGSLLIDSSPGKGTSVFCRIPCLPEDEIKNQSTILSGKGFY